jgi:hypothetical protein
MDYTFCILCHNLKGKGIAVKKYFNDYLDDTGQAVMSRGIIRTLFDLFKQFIIKTVKNLKGKGN